MHIKNWRVHFAARQVQANKSVWRQVVVLWTPQEHNDLDRMNLQRSQISHMFTCYIEYVCNFHVKMVRHVMSSKILFLHGPISNMPYSQYLKAQEGMIEIAY